MYVVITVIHVISLFYSLYIYSLHDCGLSDQATIDLAEALQKNTTLLELE